MRVGKAERRRKSKGEKEREDYVENKGERRDERRRKHKGEL